MEKNELRKGLRERKVKLPEEKKRETNQCIVGEEHDWELKLERMNSEVGFLLCEHFENVENEKIEIQKLFLNAKNEKQSGKTSMNRKMQNRVEKKYEYHKIGFKNHLEWILRCENGDNKVWTLQMWGTLNTNWDFNGGTLLRLLRKNFESVKP